MCSLTFNPTSPITYGTSVNVSCLCNNPESFATLKRDNIFVTSTENKEFVTLAAGSYNYNCSSAVTQNYTLASETSSYTVDKEASNLSLLLNGLDENVTVQVDGSVNIDAELSIPALGNIDVFDNGISIYSGASPFSDNVSYSETGNHNITVIYIASQNYTTSSKTNYIIVQDTIGPVLSNVISYTLDNESFIFSGRVDKSGYCTLFGTWGGWSNKQTRSVSANQTFNFTELSLTPDGASYTWRINCSDVSSNQVYSGNNSITTNSYLDIIVYTNASTVFRNKPFLVFGRVTNRYSHDAISSQQVYLTFNNNKVSVSTDSNGNYSYTFTAPSTTGTKEIITNTTYSSTVFENTTNIDVNQPVTNLPHYTTFEVGPGTTSFVNSSDLENVPSVTLANNWGKVNWVGNTYVSDQDFDTNVKIGYGFVSVNAANLHSSLNSSADVSITVDGCATYTIYYASSFYTSFADIKANGQECNEFTTPACTNIVCNGNTLSFTVPHFDGFGGEGGNGAVPEFSTWTMMIAILGIMISFIFIRKNNQ
jgi:hypothetical protein